VVEVVVEMAVEVTGAPNWHPETVRIECSVPVTADAEVNTASRGVKMTKWTEPLPSCVPVASPRLDVSAKGPVPGDVRMKSHACWPAGTVRPRSSALPHIPFVVPLPVHVTVPESVVETGAFGVPVAFEARLGAGTAAGVGVDAAVPVAAGAPVAAADPVVASELDGAVVVVVVVVLAGVDVSPLAAVLPVLFVEPAAFVVADAGVAVVADAMGTTMNVVVIPMAVASVTTPPRSR
jgi:hypothetical protein